MKYGYTIVYVPDVERALAFYERALGFERRFVASDGAYGELGTGDTVLSFARRDQAPLPLLYPAEDTGPGHVELTFVTDDVAAAMTRAEEAGATRVADPADKPWGQTVGFLRDPHGVLLEIGTPMAPPS